MKTTLTIGLFTMLFFVGTAFLSPKSNYTPTYPILVSEDTLPQVTYAKANVSFDAFDKISEQAKKHRSTRLIDFKTFTAYSKEKNTLILDTRSKRMYDKMHVKGAIHINFSDFTQDYLAEMIPDTNTRILIYCNNNFYQEPLFIETFASKAYVPEIVDMNPISLTSTNTYTLALNIPTYINLYGYHYRNVYELDELISSSHPNLVMEGTDVQTILGQKVIIKN